MSDNANTSVARAFEKLNDNVNGLPADSANSAQLSQLRADLDHLRQEFRDSGLFPLKEVRSNGSVDKDEPIEHTEAYQNRDNDWLGFRDGGELTRTVNVEKEDEQKAREEKQAREDERQDRLAQGQDRDGVSNGPDQRKTNR